MHVPEMFSDHGIFVFFYASMEVAASVPNITCVLQITCEFINYTLLADHLRVTEQKLHLINQRSVVYEFTSDLCDTNYIGYTCRYLHQRVEDKHSVIGKHFRDVHGLTPVDNLIQ